MTDFVATTSNSFSPQGDSDWQDKAYSRPDLHEAEIDLSGAFDWLISPETEVTVEPEESVRERRLDLLIWLMNLELRLSPYIEQHQQPEPA